MLGWFKKKFRKKKDQGPADEVDIPVEEVLTAIPELPDEAITASPESVDEEVKAVSDPVDVEEPVTAPTVEVQQSLFRRLKQGLHKTRESLVKRIDTLFLGKKVIDVDLLDELEEILITADLGVHTVNDLLAEVRDQLSRKELSDPAALKVVLKEKMQSYLNLNDKNSEIEMPGDGPFVILVLGVNGVGKTTTIGKLAQKFKQAGNNVLLVAADTFRAAAIDQIKIWGERVGVEVSAQDFGADPSSVVFDALDYALKRDFDVIIVDTAGRLHTKVNLMEELKKINRVMNKKCPGAPHEVMLVLDATTGQNALSQTKLFNEAVPLDGLTLTKLDGTAKGGIVVNICREFNIPIRFVGVGEQMDDLRDFDAQEFIDALF